MSGIVLVVVIFLGLAGGLGVIAYLTYQRKLRRAKAVERGLKMVPILIHLPPPSEDTEAGSRDLREVMREKTSQAEVLYDLIAGTATEGFKSNFYGQRHLALELIAINGVVHFYVAVPVALVSTVTKAIQTAYPGARMEEVEDHNIFNQEGRLAATMGGEMVLRAESAYPIATYEKLERDPMEALLTAITGLDKKDGVAVQIMLRPAHSSWSKRSVRLADAKRKGRKGGLGFTAMDLAQAAMKSPTQRREEEAAKLGGASAVSNLELSEVEAIEDKTKHAAFEVLIRVIVSTGSVAHSQQLLRDIATAFALFETPGMNGFKFLPALDVQGLVTAFIFRFFPPEIKSNILNSVEMATLFHLPDSQFTPTANISRQQSKQVDGPVHLPATGLLFGHNEFRGVKKEIRLSPEDRRRHTYILGQTGTGKSTMLENLAVQDMLAGNGFAFIDPHGDSAEKLLSMVPKRRAEDIVYFNPADTQFPLGLNLFEFGDPSQKDFLIQETINMLYKLYDPGHTGIIGPRYEHWYRNAALTLMSDPNGSTFIEIPKVFTDTDYLKQKFKYLKDPTVIDFWTKEMGQTSDYHKSEMLGWFVSKFGAFQNNEMMRNIIGQTKSAFNLRDIMDNKKILIVNLSKGRIGELNSQLLGMIFVIKFQAAAMSRADMPEAERNDFALYVDEFQNFSTDSFADILSEARKYRLNLIVANQFIGQLSDEIREAVFGNIGTIVAHRMGPEDAEFMVKQFAPVFDTSDLVNLPNYNSVMRLMIGGLPSQPFSLRDSAPVAGANPELGMAIKQLSAAKFGRSKAQVEAEILDRMSGRSVTPVSPVTPMQAANPGAVAIEPSSAQSAAPVTPVSSAPAAVAVNSVAAAAANPVASLSAAPVAGAPAAVPAMPAAGSVNQVPVSAVMPAPVTEVMPMVAPGTMPGASPAPAINTQAPASGPQVSGGMAAAFEVPAGQLPPATPSTTPVADPAVSAAPVTMPAPALANVMAGAQPLAVAATGSLGGTMATQPIPLADQAMSAVAATPAGFDSPGNASALPGMAVAPPPIGSAPVNLPVVSGAPVQAAGAGNEAPSGPVSSAMAGDVVPQAAALPTPAAPMPAAVSEVGMAMVPPPIGTPPVDLVPDAAPAIRSAVTSDNAAATGLVGAPPPIGTPPVDLSAPDDAAVASPLPSPAAAVSGAPVGDPGTLSLRDITGGKSLPKPAALDEIPVMTPGTEPQVIPEYNNAPMVGTGEPLPDDPYANIDVLAEPAPQEARPFVAPQPNGKPLPGDPYANIDVLTTASQPSRPEPIRISEDKVEIPAAASRFPQVDVSSPEIPMAQPVQRMPEPVNASAQPVVDESQAQVQTQPLRVQEPSFATAEFSTPAAQNNVAARDVADVAPVGVMPEVVSVSMAAPDQVALSMPAEDSLVPSADLTFPDDQVSDVPVLRPAITAPDGQPKQQSAQENMLPVGMDAVRESQPDQAEPAVDELIHFVDPNAQAVLERSDVPEMVLDEDISLSGLPEGVKLVNQEVPSGQSQSTASPAPSVASMPMTGAPLAAAPDVKVGPAPVSVVPVSPGSAPASPLAAPAAAPARVAVPTLVAPVQPVSAPVPAPAQPISQQEPEPVVPAESPTQVSASVALAVPDEVHTVNVGEPANVAPAQAAAPSQTDEDVSAAADISPAPAISVAPAKSEEVVQAKPQPLQASQNSALAQPVNRVKPEPVSSASQDGVAKPASAEVNNSYTPQSEAVDEAPSRPVESNNSTVPAVKPVSSHLATPAVPVAPTPELAIKPTQPAALASKPMPNGGTKADLGPTQKPQEALPSITDIKTEAASAAVNAAPTTEHEVSAADQIEKAEREIDDVLSVSLIRTDAKSGHHRLPDPEPKPGEDETGVDLELGEQRPNNEREEPRETPRAQHHELKVIEPIEPIVPSRERFARELAAMQPEPAQPAQPKQPVPTVVQSKQPDLHKQPRENDTTAQSPWVMGSKTPAWDPKAHGDTAPQLTHAAPAVQDDAASILPPAESLAAADVAQARLRRQQASIAMQQPVPAVAPVLNRAEPLSGGPIPVTNTAQPNGAVNEELHDTAQPKEPAVGRHKRKRLGRQKPEPQEHGMDKEIESHNSHDKPAAQVVQTAAPAEPEPLAGKLILPSGNKPKPEPVQAKSEKPKKLAPGEVYVDEHGNVIIGE